MKSVMSVMMQHMCLATTIMSLLLSSHLFTSLSNFSFSSRKPSTWLPPSSWVDSRFLTSGFDQTATQYTGLSAPRSSAPSCSGRSLDTASRMWVFSLTGLLAGLLVASSSSLSSPASSHSRLVT